MFPTIYYQYISIHSLFYVLNIICLHTNQICWSFPHSNRHWAGLYDSHQLIYVAPELYHFHIPAGSSLEHTSQLSPSESKKSEKLWDFHRIALSVDCVEMTSRSAANHLHGELCSDRTILCFIGGCFIWIKCWVQRGMSYVCLCWCQNHVWILLGCQNYYTHIHIYTLYDLCLRMIIHIKKNTSGNSFYIQGVS